MTVEIYSAIRSATPSYWLKYLAPVFPPMRSETKSNPTEFYRVFSKLQVIVRNSDWFTALFAPVVIGKRNNFGIGFFDSHLYGVCVCVWATSYVRIR